MQRLVWQNANGVELDLTSGNYGITEWEGFSNASLNIQSQQVPFQDGGVFLDALIEQRELTITLAMQDNNNLEERYQQRRELISALNPKLGEGYLIYTNDFISKRIKCVPQIPLFETHNSDTVGTPKASLSWTACTPYWEDLEETEVEIKSGELKTIMNAGDIPSQIKAIIPYVSNNPVLYNRENNKKISLNGIVEKTVEINTNIGQKKVLGISQGVNWVSGGVIKDCVYGNGKYIYVGTNIIVEDYFQGTKKTIDSGITATLNAVTFGNNKYIIGGENGQILTSTDGENWEQQQSISSTVTSMTFGDGKFVAVGSTGVYTSTDGITWEQTYTGNNFLDVIYAEEEGIFVVGGRYNNLNSTDGENWSVITIGTPIYSLCYGKDANNNGIFFAIEYYFSSGQWTTILYQSTDGTNWTQQTVFQGVAMYSIVYGNNKFIISAGKNNYVSTDGTTWEHQENVFDYSMTKILFENNEFIGVGSGGAITKSQDGAEWSLITGGVTFNINDFVYANNKFVAVGTGIDGNVATSLDGKEWELQDSGTTKILFSIAYGNNVFVAVGESGTILTSSDGIEWTSRTSGITNQISCVTFGDGKFVAVAGTGGIRYSEDGITWQLSLAGYSFLGVCYGGNKFVAVGYNGYTGISEDGINWTTNVFATEFSKVFYGGGLYVAMSSDGILFTSEDGINWADRSIETNKDFKNGVYGNGTFIVVGGTIYATSTDGKSWLVVTTPYYLNSVIFENNKFISAGSLGVITESTEMGTENLITKLTNDSDMTFNLETGNNELFFEDMNKRPATIVYRQKYIGV